MDIIDFAFGWELEKSFPRGVPRNTYQCCNRELLYSGKNLLQRALNKDFYLRFFRHLSKPLFYGKPICRSSHQRYSVKKGVLRNFAKFTGKHLCQSLFYNNVAGSHMQRH